MTFRNFEAKLILRVALLCLTLSGPALVIIKGWPEVLVFLLPLIFLPLITTNCAVLGVALLNVQARTTLLEAMGTEEQTPTRAGQIRAGHQIIRFARDRDGVDLASAGAFAQLFQREAKFDQGLGAEGGGF